MPVDWLIVACDPALVDCSEMALLTVPENAHVPAVFVVLFLSFSVPAENVIVRVDPSVSASAKDTVAPGALIVTGESIVMPLAVIVCVPEVAAKVCTLPEALQVIVADNVRSP